MSQFLTEKLKKAANVVYLAANEDVAEELSTLMKEAAATIETLEERCAFLGKVVAENCGPDTD